MLAFEPKFISNKDIKYLTKLIEGGFLDCERIRSKSKAAFGLCIWINNMLRFKNICDILIKQAGSNWNQELEELITLNYT